VVVDLEARTEMTITLNHYLLVSGLLFAIGFAGVRRCAGTSSPSSCAWRSMLSAANSALVAFSRFNLGSEWGCRTTTAQALVVLHHHRRRGRGRGRSGDHRAPLFRAQADYVTSRTSATLKLPG